MFTKVNEKVAQGPQRKPLNVVGTVIQIMLC